MNIVNISRILFTKHLHSSYFALIFHLYCCNYKGKMLEDNMKKPYVGFLFLICSVLLLTACSMETKSSSVQHRITVSGSTSVGPLAEKLAAKYEKTNDINIEVNQIGSSAGIENAIKGVSDLGMSSRELKEEELSQKIESTIIAYDGIVVITNRENDVQQLTMQQVKDIYTGKITNWKELGGEDLEIVVVSREDGSGSRDAFQEIVGYTSRELIQNAIIASGNGNIKTTIQMNKQAIGFISFEYMDDSITSLKIDGVDPTADNVLNNLYPLARPFLFVHHKLTEESQQWLDFILSTEGQKVVQEAGAIPLLQK